MNTVYGGNRQKRGWEEVRDHVSKRKGEGREEVGVYKAVTVSTFATKWLACRTKKIQYCEDIEERIGSMELLRGQGHVM